MYIYFIPCISTVYSYGAVLDVVCTCHSSSSSSLLLRVIQKLMSLKYEPASEPLHFSGGDEQGGRPGRDSAPRLRPRPR